MAIVATSRHVDVASLLCQAVLGPLLQMADGEGGRPPDLAAEVSWALPGSMNFLITSTGRRGGRSGVRVYKAGRSPDETKRDEMKRSENERTKRKE